MKDEKLNDVVLENVSGGISKEKALAEALKAPDADCAQIFMPWTSIEMNENNQNTAATGVVMQVQGGVYKNVYPEDDKTVDAIFDAPTWSER